MPLVARRNGVEIEEIDLWLLGGVARMAGYPKTAGAELRFAIAGPAVTAAIVAVFGALALALPASAPAALRAIVAYQVMVNARSSSSTLCRPSRSTAAARCGRWSGCAAATSSGRRRSAAAIGRGLGFAMIGLGVVCTVLGGAFGGIWLAVVGFFVIVAARAEESGVLVRRRLRRPRGGPADGVPGGN